LRFTLSEDLASRKAFDYLGLPRVNGSIQRSLRDVNYASADSRIPLEDQRVSATVNWQPSAELTVRDVVYYLYANRLWAYPSQFVFQPALDLVRRGDLERISSINIIRGSWGTRLDDGDRWIQKHGLSGIRPGSHGRNQRYVNSYSGGPICSTCTTSQPGFFATIGFSRNWQNTSVRQYSIFAEIDSVLLPSLSAVGGIRTDHQAVERRTW